MKFELGNKEFEVASPFAKPDFEAHRKKGGKAISIFPIGVHAHDCLLGSRNPVRPTHFAAHLRLRTFALDKKGRRDKKREKALIKALFDPFDLIFSFDDLDISVDVRHPPQAVKIPWPKLMRGINAKTSKFRVVAWTDHEYFTLIPPGRSADVGAILGVPKVVHFDLFEIGRCGEETAGGPWIHNSAKVKVGYPKGSGTGKVLRGMRKASKTKDADEAKHRKIFEEEMVKRDARRRNAYRRKVQKAYGKP